MVSPIPKRGYAPIESDSVSDTATVITLGPDSSGLPPLIPKLQRYPTVEPLATSVNAAQPRSGDRLDNETAGAGGPQLGMLKLAALTFFAVSGGPFGVEPLVRTGGAGWTALGLLGVPYVWGLPMAMMTAELSTALPDSGGYIVWIHRAFGDFWATQASIWTVCNAFLDNAMYPIMFVDYLMAFRRSLAQSVGAGAVGDDDRSLSGGSLLLVDDGVSTEHGSASALNQWGEEEETESALSRWLIGMGMTLPIVFLNIRGVDFVGDAAVSFGVLSVTPFIVMVLVGAPALSWNAVSAPAPEPRWGTFLTVLLWNTCGYDSAGTLAAEVAEPGKVYMPAMLLCILLSTLVYLCPILVGVSAEGTQIDNWVDGYLTDVAAAIGGRWLAGWVTLAGAMSSAGLLNTLLCTTSRALAAMGQRGLMPKIFGRLHSRYMTPHIAIGVMACAIAALMLSDFETLIEANMMTYILKLVLEYAALVKLRLSEPELPRPYRIAIEVPGLCVLFLPPIVLSCALAYLAETSTLVATGGVLVLGVVAHFIRRIVRGPEGFINDVVAKPIVSNRGDQSKANSFVSVGVGPATFDESFSQSSDDDEALGLIQKKHQRQSSDARHSVGDNEPPS